MGDKSKIEWTDATWNCLRGCSRVSEGCRNCYAERVAARFSGAGQPYEGLAIRHVGSVEPRWTGKVRFIPEHLTDPIRWRKPRRVFVNSMSDIFHESIPTETVLQIFEVMALAKRHTFQILTKRPARMKYLLTYGEKMECESAEHHRLLCTMPLSNVWLGVSVEDQKTADERIPLLLETPAAVRWASYEPALGPVDFHRWTSYSCSACGSVVDIDKRYWTPVCPQHGDVKARRPLDWIVAGGESGPGARPSNPEWFRKVRDDCQTAGVPFFFKQWGGWSPVKPENFCRISGRRYTHETFAWGKDGKKYCALDPAPDDFPKMMFRVGKRKAGRLLDGREWNDFPKGCES